MKPTVLILAILVAALPAPGAEPIDLTKPATVESGPWKYVYSIIGKGSKSERRAGELTYAGKPISDAVPGDRIDTPWGRMQLFSGDYMYTRGWLLMLKQTHDVRIDNAKGRLLPPPGVAIATRPAERPDAPASEAAPLPKGVLGGPVRRFGDWTYTWFSDERPVDVSYGALTYRGKIVTAEGRQWLWTPWGRLSHTTRPARLDSLPGWTRHSYPERLPEGKEIEGPDPVTSRRVRERYEKLLAGLDKFTVALRYVGPSDKPYYAVQLSTLPEHPATFPAFNLFAKIDRAWARRLLDALTEQGFLARAIDAEDLKPARVKAETGYVLTAQIGGSAAPGALQPLGAYHLAEHLGWDLAMLHRLEELRRPLEGDAGKAMDTLLERLSGHRAEWEKAAAAESANQRALDEQLASAKTRLAAILPETMTVSRAEVSQTKAGSGLLLHASQKDPARLHPYVALFLWPCTNTGQCPYEDRTGAHTFVRVGQSQEYVVFYTGREDPLRAKIVEGFCPAQPAEDGKQGIQGKVLKMKGNFMPGPGPRPGAPKEAGAGGTMTPLSVPVHVFKGKVKPFDKPDPKHAQLVKVVQADKDGAFKLALPPGEYTVVAEISGKMYLNIVQGDGTWATVKVEADKWTTFNVEETTDAAF